MILIDTIRDYIYELKDPCNHYPKSVRDMAASIEANVEMMFTKMVDMGKKIDNIDWQYEELMKRRKEVRILKEAMNNLERHANHYAELLNMNDGGKRMPSMMVESAEKEIEKLKMNKYNLDYTKDV